MSEQYQRNAKNNRSLDLKRSQRSGVSRNDTDQTPQTNENTSGYIKLASGLALLAVAFIFGLSILFLIPAAIIIALGVLDLTGQKTQSLPTANNQERELLSAIRDNGGSITPAEAAMETSLTVREADTMLSELASAGHVMVDSRNGALFYSLPSREDPALEGSDQV